MYCWQTSSWDVLRKKYLKRSKNRYFLPLRRHFLSRQKMPTTRAAQTLPTRSFQRQVHTRKEHKQFNRTSRYPSAAKRLILQHRSIHQGTNSGCCLNARSDCAQGYKFFTIETYVRRELTHFSTWQNVHRAQHNFCLTMA